MSVIGAQKCKELSIFKSYYLLKLQKLLVNNCINPVQEILLINTVALAYFNLKRYKDAVYYLKKQLKISGEISRYLSGDNPPLCCSSIHRHWTPRLPNEYALLCCYEVW